jgi:Mlc titration factor MtfA (ptsG expression regulator)
MRRSRSSRGRTLPREWQGTLTEHLSWWPLADAGQQAVLEQLAVEFLATKSFEGSAGFDPTNDVIVTIAAQACRLIVGLDLGWYRDVTAIIVYPSTAVRPGTRHLEGGISSAGPANLAGEAMLHGPVMLAWDEVRAGMRHPERGRNVVFHEFAHKLDMADGSASGVPHLRSRDAYRRWENVMGEVLNDLRTGEPRFIDGYGALGPTELFAVATEAFFGVPGDLRDREPEVYALLKDFYRQDPATPPADPGMGRP